MEECVERVDLCGHIYIYTSNVFVGAFIFYVLDFDTIKIISCILNIILF